MNILRADRVLTTVAVVTSLGLTALTVAAVVVQGQTLRDRELDAARNTAADLAAERQRLLEAEMLAAFETAASAYERSPAALDVWVTSHDFFDFIGVEPRPGDLAVFPLTPTEAPLEVSADLLTLPEPRLASAEPAVVLVSQPLPPPAAELAAVNGDLGRMYDAIGLLITGIRERGLDLHREAGQTFRQAADLLAIQPGSIRGTFEASLAAFDSLIQTNPPLAAAALDDLVERMLAAHENAWGQPELDAVLVRAATLEERLRLAEHRATLAGGAAAPQKLLLNPATHKALEARAAQRRQLDELSTLLARGLALAAVRAPNEIEFDLLHASGGEALVVATGMTTARIPVALVTELDRLIDRHWAGERATDQWTVTTGFDARSAPVSHQLPASFGRRHLVPSPAFVAALEYNGRLRLMLLITVAAGTALAWTVVIWLIQRSISQQRALVAMQRRFMADVSHELKTPLALIRLHAETLTARRIKAPERRYEYEETIARESARLTRLLDNILDFSRIESGTRRYDFAECNVSEVLAHAWSLFAPRLQAEGFTLHFEVADDIPPITADGHALEQVFVNLLQNAHRYSPASGDRTVALHACRHRQHIVVTVQDRGIGMTRAEIRRLGRSFERGSDPRVRKLRGTGLGLAIVRHIVDAHSGTLSVQSEPGQGSSFTVRLPLG